MSTITEELNRIFAIPPAEELPLDVLGELQSICRLHSISAQELSYKWESYTMKMGTEQTKLDITTVRAFKKDLQEIVEREARSKSHLRSTDRRGAFATPRNATKGGDVFGMCVHPSHLGFGIAHDLQARRYHSGTAVVEWRQQAKSSIRDTLCYQIQQGERHDLSK